MLSILALLFITEWANAQDLNSSYPQAEALYEKKQYDSSLLILDRLLTDTETDKALLTNAWLLKAKNHNRKKEYELRLASASAALGVAEKHLHGDTLHAVALRAKGDAFIRTRTYDSSIVYLQKAEKLFVELQDWSQSASCMVGQGVNHYRLRQLVAADSMLTKAMRLMEEKLDKLPSLYGTSSNVLGAIYRAQGDHEKALINYQAAARFHEKYTQNIQRLTYAYNNLGTAYFSRGDYDKAEEFLLLAELNANKQEPPDFTSLTNVYNNLLLTYTYKKAYTTAKRYGELSLALYESKKVKETPKDQSLFYNNLALLSLELDDFDQTGSYLDKAFALGGETSQSCANMGYYYYRQGDDASARPWLEKAIDLMGETDPLNLSKLYRYRAIGASRSNQPALANQYFTAAIGALVPDYDGSVEFRLPFMNQVRSKRELLRALTAQGEHMQSTGAERESVKIVFLSAIALSDSMYVEYKAEGSRRFLKNELVPLYENTIRLLSEDFHESGDPEIAETIFSIMERGKSNLLIDLLQIRNSNQMAGVPIDLIEKEKSLQIDIDFFRAEATRASLNGDSTKRDLYRGYELEKLNDWDQLLEQLQQQYPRYYRQRHQAADRRLSEARAKLDPGAMLIEFFTGPEHTFALALTSKSAHFSHLGNTDSLRVKVLDFIKTINQPGLILNDMTKAYQQLSRQGHALHEVLVDPLLSQTTDSINSLTMIPDGFLNLLSFEALVTEKPADNPVDFINLPYLIKSYKVSYALAASLPDSKGYLGRNVLAMAPFGQSELPNTQVEVDRIREHLGGSFYPNSGSESDFRNAANDYGILHLATHGVLNEQSPQLSYLSFSNTGTTDTTDQKLHAYELENMDLDAQLVVLSACETGSGQVVSGEGVMSLARAFSYTGVPSLVMSLWQVDDQAGSELMDSFYREMIDDRSKSTALREAKLTYLRQADQLHAHPYFWSQFVLVGDPDPLRNNAGFSGNFTVIVILISVAMVIVLIILLTRNMFSSREGD